MAKLSPQVETDPVELETSSMMSWIQDWGTEPETNLMGIEIPDGDGDDDSDGDSSGGGGGSDHQHLAPSTNESLGIKAGACVKVIATSRRTK